MFEIQENGIYPLIKISTPEGVDFLAEHLQIINEHGYVWFCRFGKNNMKIQSLRDSNHILILKDIKRNGGKVYLAEFDKVEQSPNVTDEVVPKYYRDITKQIGVWIRINQIKEIPQNILERSFVINNSNGSVAGILRSMCPATFLRCIRHFSDD